MRMTMNEFTIESPPSMIKQRKIVMSELASSNLNNESLIKKPVDVTSSTPSRVAQYTQEK